jgi:hypothetical protein
LDDGPSGRTVDPVSDGQTLKTEENLHSANRLLRTLAQIGCAARTNTNSASADRPIAEAPLEATPGHPPNGPSQLEVRMQIPSLKEVVSTEEWQLRCDLAAS